MKYLRTVILCLAPVLVTGLTGCASTPSGRAKEYAEVFERFPDPVKENVRQGRIEPGYTEQMVLIAKGEPDRKYLRQTARGDSVVWAYVGVETETESQRVMGRFHFRDNAGRIRTTTDDVWADIQHKREFEKLRVEFTDGVVQAIERLQR
jgi:hypothetical protein